MLQNGNPTARPLSLSPGGFLPLSQQLNKPTPRSPAGRGCKGFTSPSPALQSQALLKQHPSRLFGGISCPFSFPSLLFHLPPPPPQVSRAADCLVLANLAWGSSGLVHQMQPAPHPQPVNKGSEVAQGPHQLTHRWGAATDKRFVCTHVCASVGRSLMSILMAPSSLR